MKLKIAFALSVLLGLVSVSHAESDVDASAFRKVFDGRAATCKGMADEGRRAYMLTDMRVKEVNRNGFILGLNERYLKCVAHDGYVQWVSISEAEATTYDVKDFDGNLYTITMENPEVVAITSNYDVLEGVKNNKGIQNDIEISVLFDKILDAKSREDLNKSGQAMLDLDMANRGVITYRGPDGERQVIGMRYGGSYRSTLVLRQMADGTMSVRF